MSQLVDGRMDGSCGAEQRVAVLIPARQEQSKLPRVLSGVRQHSGLLATHVIVVDDGSSDDTARVATEAGADLVIRHVRSLGKGAALRHGFEAALDLGAQWVVTLDADGQHDPEEIVRLLASARKQRLDLLVGWRRDRVFRSPWVNLATNWGMSLLIASISGLRLRDSQCGFRVHSAELLRSVKLSRNGFDLETEIILEARRVGARVGQCPVRTIYPSDRRSWIRPIGDAVRFFWLLLSR